MKLGAYPTYQEVTVGGHLSQDDGGSVFDLSIGLRKWYQDDIALVHGRNSGLYRLINWTEYSGSASS